MGLPSTSYAAFYRNNMTDVLNFFNVRHAEHYKVYNLCEEKKYAPNIFYKQGYFPFQDHEAPPLNLIRPFCEDAKKFLDEDPKNVVAIHCLAGKGRTGTLISCLLLYLGEFDTAADCLKYYGMMRVDNGRGVTVPSQIRYVFYFEQILKNKIPHPITFKKLRIKKIRMVTIPSFNKISFVVENKVDKINNVFDYKKKENLEDNKGYIDFELGDEGFVICGDVKILFFTFSMFGSKEKIFKLWFNTNFVPQDDVLEVKKDLIDKACKDKKCKKFKHNFKIEVHMIDVDI
jgi:phosphatidylinositol-3,4,5-trisphosphate 3-phosphatase/dual-specificity protein phosphatase PTEN